MKGISLYRMKRTEQVYTFRYEKTGETKHFAVDQLVAYIKSRGFKPETILFHYDLVKHLAERGGAEADHFESLPEAALEEPCLLCEMDDGSHVLADGVHRALRRVARGDTHFPAYLVKQPIWERFLIIDFPEGIVDWADFLTHGDRNGPIIPI